jgi:hypothetical protein
MGLKNFLFGTYWFVHYKAYKENSGLGPRIEGYITVNTSATGHNLVKYIKSQVMLELEDESCKKVIITNISKLE